MVDGFDNYWPKRFRSRYLPRCSVYGTQWKERCSKKDTEEKWKWSDVFIWRESQLAYAQFIAQLPRIVSFDPKTSVFRSRAGLGEAVLCQGKVAVQQIWGQWQQKHRSDTRREKRKGWERSILWPAFWKQTCLKNANFNQHARFVTLTTAHSCTLVLISNGAHTR